MDTADSTAEESDDDDAEDSSDPFVNALLAQLEEVRGKVEYTHTHLENIQYSRAY
jgi:hypothetical protein